ncbi:MAG: Flp pilus assembly protein CpaB [Chloroflexota bacterium]|nr:Flp pilus assembly protein CpaB [Chloroflexota bacterium]MDE3194405.1 Flp pilus assembly protein CpaB [Chloroflexota bacterium]
MTQQRLLLALAIAAGLVAGVLYWAGAQRVSVVVAAADLRAARALAVTDLETRQLPPDALPPGAVTDPSAAAGRYPRAPIYKGQLVLAAALADAPAAFAAGVSVPTGYRAVAVPVETGHALGGAVLPGSRVDVIAVPVPGRSQADRATELLVAGALVVDVRGEYGAPFEHASAAGRPATAVRERIGSVIVAVGPSAELRIADRIGSSTFVLALVGP